MIDNPFDVAERIQRYSHVHVPDSVLLINWQHFDIWFEPEYTYAQDPIIVARYGDSPEQYFAGHALDIIYRNDSDDPDDMITHVTHIDTALTEGTMIALQLGLCYYDFWEDD